jgi:hypothetical protein
MITSESIKELAGALSKAQGAITPAKMDKENSFLKNKYADFGSVIEATRPALLANGLSVTQHPAVENECVTLTTRLMHASGEWIESSMTLPIGEGRGISLAQSMGGVITYLRRYSLSSILGVYADEDTDGNGDVKKQEKKSEPKPEQHANGTRAELAPAALKSYIAKLAGENKSKPLPNELQPTPAALSQILGGDDKRHEMTKYLTGQTSFSTSSPNYIGDGFVMVMHRWLKPSYDANSKSWVVDPVAEREAHAAHIEALKASGQESLI